MKFSILLDIVFDVLSKRKITAAYLAEKYAVSPRTVYRYVEIIAENIPVQIKRGRNGGIILSDDYVLPVNFMNAEEYDATLEALGNAYAQTSAARFLTAREKIAGEKKTSFRELSFSTTTENVLVCDVRNPRALEKFRILESAVETHSVLEIEYAETGKAKTLTRVEPHLLVYKENVWYAYAFCHTQRDFRLFNVNRIRSAVKTEELFHKRPFSKEAVLLLKNQKNEPIEIRFEIEETALETAKDAFGLENVRLRNGSYYADATFFDEESLAAKILGFGKGIRVVSPSTVKRKICSLLNELSQLYP